MAASSHEEKKPAKDPFDSLLEKNKLAPEKIKKIVDRMKTSLDRLRTEIDSNEEPKKDAKEVKEGEVSEKDFKATDEYQRLIWLADTQYDAFSAEGLRLVTQLLANPSQSAEQEKYYYAGVQNFALAMERLTAFIQDPTLTENGKTLLEISVILDTTANTGQPGSVAGEVFGKFLLIVGAALLVAAALGVALAGLSTIGVGFAGTAIQSIASSAICGGTGATSLSVGVNTAYIGIQSFLVGVLGASIMEGGYLTTLISAPTPRLPQPKPAKTLEDLYKQGQKMVKPK